MIDLRQGDCLELMKEIPDKSVDMILCDLPYGTTACKWDNVIPFEPLWEQYKRIIKDNGAIVLFGSEPFMSNLIISNMVDFKYKWIWNKKQTGNPFLCRKQPLKIYEEIAVFHSKTYYPQMRKGKLRRKGGGKRDNLFSGNITLKTNDIYYPTAIIEFPNCRDKGKRLHPTQKPSQLIKQILTFYTKEGDLIFDPFAGSCVVEVCCHKLQRRFIGCEINKEYFDKGSKWLDKEMAQMSIFDCLKTE